jgi:predicted nicotinamide N-methyase
VELVERDVTVAGRVLSLLVPRDSEALLDEEAFAHDEFMPYWAELWPSGLALAEAVTKIGPWTGPSGSSVGRMPTGAHPVRVLELGCGLGLPSLVAALDGADVVATDWAPDAVALLERNAERVGARLAALRWNWNEPAPVAAELVLAADVLYEARNGPQVLAALDTVVAEGGEAWIADPDRPGAEDFFSAAATAWAVDELRPRIRRLRRR